MNNLGLIYKKIKSVRYDEKEVFEESFSEVCQLIDKQFQNGYFWAAFYSYFELFSHLVKIGYFETDKYFLILNLVQNILNSRFLSKEEVIEIFINNPFLKKEFLIEVEKILGKENFSKIKNKIDLIFSNLIVFQKDEIESLYFSISLHDFLKFLKFLKDGDVDFDEEKIIQIVVNNIFTYEVKVVSEKITDIIDFGLANKNSQNMIEFIKKILLKITLHLYVNSNDFTGWKKIFLISTYENMGRFLRIVKDYDFSSFLYLLAAIENWFIYNYGYCSKCIYQISKLTQDNFKKEFLISLAINIALFEVSFMEEINYWKKEITRMISIEKMEEDICNFLQEIVYNFQRKAENLYNFDDLVIKVKDLCVSIIEKMKKEKIVNLLNRFKLSEN
ncbi:MAG: hypothetical protein ACK4GR_00895 [bacterium]